MSIHEVKTVATAFCPHEGCGFTPQSISPETNGPGGDLEWLEGRVRHHDQTHDHNATVVIYSPKIKLSKVV